MAAMEAEEDLQLLVVPGLFERDQFLHLTRKEAVQNKVKAIAKYSLALVVFAVLFKLNSVFFVNVCGRSNFGQMLESCGKDKFHVREQVTAAVGSLPQQQSL